MTTLKPQFQLRQIESKSTIANSRILAASKGKMNIVDGLRIKRAKYLSTLDPKDKNLINGVKKAAGLPLIDFDVAIKKSNLGISNSILKGEWSDPKFHLRNRLTSLQLFEELFPWSKELDLLDPNDPRYNFSVLPLPMADKKMSVLLNNLPSSDYFDYDNTDPYGIFNNTSSILNHRGEIIASRKFPRVLLVNFDELFCPNGCSGCYKTEATRENHPVHSNTPKNVISHMKDVSFFLKMHEEVDTMIISGGEPLLVSNEALERMLFEIENIDSLRIVRICTGIVFMGLPMRVDDEMLQILKNFEKRTGKIVSFHLHLINHEQFTPEAILATRKIKNMGFVMNAQVPIKEGMNFFRDDIKKTIDFLKKTVEICVYCGVDPYKFIVDMHPRTLRHLPPLEILLSVWSHLSQSGWEKFYGGIKVPRLLNILCREGNYRLDPLALLSMDKKFVGGNMEYTLPTTFSYNHESGISSEKPFTYIEPVMKGYNDNKDSLKKLKKEWSLQMV
ncbi:MAG: 4Fe-4S cluster-binding domain-containing protein [Candidatus Micrarchaeia archaeon]